MSLRVCFLTTFYPPFNFGGDGLAVQRLARALARRGHEVTVVHDADAFTVLTGNGASCETSPDPSGMRVITLRSRLPLVSTMLTHQTGRPIVNGARLRRILDEGRFDVVNFSNISLIGGPGLLAYAPAAVKVYLAHEHWLVCPTHVLWRHQRERCDARECFRCQLAYKRPPQLWRYTDLLDRNLRAVDVFVAMSEFSRAKHREFGFAHDMEVLPHFVPDQPDPSTWTLAPRPHDRPYFLFVGRLEQIKGLDDVLRASAAYADADVLVAGDGEYRAAIEAAAAGNPRLRVLGRVPADALRPYYQHAIALLAPSICFETFGITLIEAFSFGTPVIARRLGPFPEILDQSGGGELFDSVDDLIARMRAFQWAPNRRAELGQAGYRAFRERWCESAVTPRYIDTVMRARRSFEAHGIEG